MSVPAARVTYLARSAEKRLRLPFRSWTCLRIRASITAASPGWGKMLSAETVIKLRLRKLRRAGFIACGALGAIAGFLSMNSQHPVQSAPAQSVASGSIAPQQPSSKPPTDRFASAEPPHVDAMASALAVATLSRELWSISDGAIASMPNSLTAGEHGQAKAMQASERDDPQTEAAAQDQPPFVGIWVPQGGSCSIRSFKEGSLPAVITEQGAWAGETFCLFKKLKRTRTDWKAVASCSDSNEDWTTDVQLSVKANRLIWKSKSGTQSYSKCSSDTLVAANR